MRFISFNDKFTSFVLKVFAFYPYIIHHFSSLSDTNSSLHNLHSAPETLPATQRKTTRNNIYFSILPNKVKLLILYGN